MAHWRARARVDRITCARGRTLVAEDRGKPWQHPPRASAPESGIVLFTMQHRLVHSIDCGHDYGTNACVTVWKCIVYCMAGRIHIERNGENWCAEMSLRTAGRPTRNIGMEGKKLYNHRYLRTKPSSSVTTSVMVGRSWCSCSHMRSTRVTISGHHSFRRPAMEGLRKKAQYITNAMEGMSRSHR
jgi:hypothetical protein